MLCEAFKSLPNLETIDIRDFNSATRYRDGERAEWHSYGAPTLRELGSRPVVMTGGLRTDGIFQGVVIAAARSGTHAPNLELITRHTAVSPLAFYIPPDLKPELAAYLVNVKKLHLSVGLADAKPLAAFLHLTPYVTWLRVNHLHGHPATAQEFLEWLATPVNNETADEYAKACATASQENEAFPIAPLNLPLESLDLGFGSVSNVTLRSTVDKFNLHSLSVWKMNIYPDPSLDKDDDGTVKLWPHFLESLEGSSVRRLTLGHVTETSLRTNQHQFRSVTFKGGYDAAQLKLPARRYRSEMFKRAAEDTVVADLTNLAYDYGTEDDSDASDHDHDDEDEDNDDDDDGDQANGGGNGDDGDANDAGGGGGDADDAEMSD